MRRGARDLSRKWLCRWGPVRAVGLAGRYRRKRGCGRANPIAQRATGLSVDLRGSLCPQPSPTARAAPAALRLPQLLLSSGSEMNTHRPRLPVSPNCCRPAPMSVSNRSHSAPIGGCTASRLQVSKPFGMMTRLVNFERNGSLAQFFVGVAARFWSPHHAGSRLARLFLTGPGTAVGHCTFSTVQTLERVGPTHSTAVPCHLG